MTHLAEHLDFTYQTGYEMERDAVRSGMYCRGEGCSGWVSTDFDTWEKCSCGNHRDYPHPEMDAVFMYVLTGARGEMIGHSAFKVDAQDLARNYKAAGVAVRLRRVLVTHEDRPDFEKALGAAYAAAADLH